MRQRVLRLLSNLAGQLFNAALRAVVPTVVFTTCVVLLLRSLGVPMPSAHELLKQFEGLSKLAKI